MTREQLNESLKKALGVNTLPTMVNAQIVKFTTERGWSYEQIARAFAYYVVVQGNTPQLKYGIGIVPNVMDEAMEYFRRREEKEIRQRAQMRRAQGAEQPTIICTKPLRRTATLKQKIDLGKLWEDKDKNG